MSRTYPYTAWVIQPSGKPVEVELVERAFDHYHPDWDRASSGKSYHVGYLHPTKEKAIDAGLITLDAQQAKLDKQQSTLNKKRAKLIAARCDDQ